MFRAIGLFFLLAVPVVGACDGCGFGAPDGGPPSPTDGGANALVDAGFDAGPSDAGIDAGPRDAGFDAGPSDAGFDAGPQDAGFDAGPSDAGFDAGPLDAGLPDAGACLSTQDCASPLVCSELRDVGTTVEPWCRAPQAGDPLLSVCAAGATCASKLCVPRARVCSEACELSARDCGAGVCTAYPFAFDVGDTPTWIGVCAAGCAADDDCPDGRLCTYNGNPLTNAFDRVCEEPDGAKVFGAVCGADNECESGLCLASQTTCTTPCEGAADCAAPLATCDDVTVATPDGQGNTLLRMCR